MELCDARLEPRQSSLLMGAASCDVPAIVLSGGPGGTDNPRQTSDGYQCLAKFSEAIRAGKMSLSDLVKRS